jgi:2-furoyl-CoA dehydrogenase large subunit
MTDDESDTPVTDGGAAMKAPETDDQSADESGLIGEEVKRYEDKRLITGQGSYIDDMEPVEDIHHVALLRSPHAHAAIEGIDVSAALAMSGVKTVVTGQEVAEVTEPFPVTAQNGSDNYYSMAVDRVRYQGEPVAAVVAESKYIANDALEKIDVDYDRLEPVIDPEEAVEDDAPQLHDVGNVANHRDLSYGDPDTAFAEADNVVSERFEYPRTAAPPLETYGVIADWDDADDSITLWANYQGPMSMNAVMAKALGMPENRMNINVPSDQGGGFGVKTSIYPYMVLNAVVARKAEVPVKWIEARDEHLMASSHHANRVQYIEGAVDDDGDLRAVRFKQYDDFGAYLRPPGPGATFRSIGNWQGAYDIEGIDAEVFAVQTNKCPVGPHRGYSCHIHYFALEGLMDRIAEQLDIDPGELRLRNMIDEREFPFRSLTGGFYDSGRYKESLQQGLEAIDYETWKDKAGDNGDSYIGIGMSAIVDPHVSNMGYLETARPDEMRRLPKSGSTEIVQMTMGLDSTVRVNLTSLPEGHGHETTARQIVADKLKIDPDDIVVNTGINTENTPWEISTGTYSSRFGSIGHKALAEASADVVGQLERIGAHLMDADEDEVELTADGVVGPDGQTISHGRIAGTTYWNPSELPEDQQPLIGTLTATKMDTSQPIDDEDRVNSSQTYAFGGHFVVVEIDKETGDVDILDYVAVHDSGTLVNPMIVRGQIEGGTLMGVTDILYEYHEYDTDTGQLKTDTLMDYGMPTAKEAPKYRQEHMETPSPLTEIGSKGVGEAGTIAAPAAVTNAIQNAVKDVGINVNTAPVTPDRMWELLDDADAN